MTGSGNGGFVRGLMGDTEKNSQASGGAGAGSKGGGGEASRSWGTTASWQSVLTTSGGSTGSSLSLARFSHGDDVGNKKKERGQRVTTGDKSGRGLRQFSKKSLVCEKVESRGRTTYNEVADELVVEFADPGNSVTPPDQQQYDEKNIRQRVYDALNVLMAMAILCKDRKEITWKGSPRTSLGDIEELKGWCRDPVVEMMG